MQELASILLYPLVILISLGFNQVRSLSRLGLWAPVLSALVVSTWMYYPLTLYWRIGGRSPNTLVVFLGTYICLCLGIRKFWNSEP